MMAVILAGGKGARLRPYTMTIPKPLLPIGDVPILEVLIRQLTAAGVERLVLTLGYMPHLFAAMIGDGSRFGLKIEHLAEDPPRGTAGPIAQVCDLEDDFLVVNGDTLTTIDFRRIFERHKEAEAWGTIGIHRRDVFIDYGVVESSADGLLDRIVEKPTISYDVSMGVNVLSRKCLEFIPNSGKFDMPDLMMAIRKAGKRVLCYREECYWQDIGRFDDYLRAAEDFQADPNRFLPGSGAA